MSRVTWVTGCRGGARLWRRPAMVGQFVWRLRCDGGDLRGRRGGEEMERRQQLTRRIDKRRSCHVVETGRIRGVSEAAARPGVQLQFGGGGKARERDGLRFWSDAPIWHFGTAQSPSPPSSFYLLGANHTWGHTLRPQNPVWCYWCHWCVVVCKSQERLWLAAATFGRAHQGGTSLHHYVASIYGFFTWAPEGTTCHAWAPVAQWCC